MGPENPSGPHLHEHLCGRLRRPHLLLRLPGQGPPGGLRGRFLLAAAKKTGVRTARRERIGYTAPAPSTDPSVVEKEVRARLAFYRWSERYFGEEYPLGVSDRLALFAGELARLYPSFTADELKEDLNTFACVNGPIRRLKASSALKAALKARQEALSTPPAKSL